MSGSISKVPKCGGWGPPLKKGGGQDRGKCKVWEGTSSLRRTCEPVLCSDIGADNRRNSYVLDHYCFATTISCILLLHASFLYQRGS